ncbi:chemotaxis protein CheD [Salibacterium salarium]|uniref:Probable chemoreceptor glutamine deamidase CheD n=1 Tax=Salibacterium salarium TaxID=284579 RepID=A0A3R9QL81_9BACI|nr:chemotaxis protein CheD [Salibacterium salarium]RSL32835.1 chemotaxis protein CheD [Salibacterium salarium]
MTKIEQAEVVKVGMADWKLAEAPSTIRTSGLGSCIGAVVYDEAKQIAALAHVMLPDSAMAKNKEANRAKFADTALEDALYSLQQWGCSVSRLKAKIAGGAQMFSFSSNNEMMRIGPRNAEAVKEILGQYRIRLIAEDTGGNKGRTIEFNPADKTLHIRTVNQGESII